MCLAKNRSGATPVDFFSPQKTDSFKKYLSSPFKRVFFKKRHAIYFKNLQSPPTRTEKCLWLRSPASFCRWRPGPLRSMASKLRHEPPFLCQARLKLLDQRWSSQRDELGSTFNLSAHDFLEKTMKTTLVLTNSIDFGPLSATFYPSRSDFRTPSGGPLLALFGRRPSQEVP